MAERQTVSWIADLVCRKDPEVEKALAGPLAASVGPEGAGMERRGKRAAFDSTASQGPF